MTKRFSIKELEVLSGVKSHTIRVWELRYRLLHPQRSASNIRLYTVGELSQLLHVSLLHRCGYKMSYLSQLDHAQLEEKIEQSRQEEDQQEAMIGKLIISMYTMLTDDFETTLNHCFLTWSADTVVQNILFLFLKRTSLLWRGNNISEEHFAVTAVRNKLIGAIEKTNAVKERDKTILLFLPEGNHLDLLLLYTNYLLKCQGWQVWYMGNNVSLANLKAALEAKAPHYIFTYLPNKNQFRLHEISAHLNECSLPCKFIVSTYPQHQSLAAGYENIISMEYNEALQLLTT